MLLKTSDSRFGWTDWLFLSSSMIWSAIEIVLLVKTQGSFGFAFCGHYVSPIINSKGGLQSPSRESNILIAILPTRLNINRNEDLSSTDHR